MRMARSSYTCVGMADCPAKSTMGLQQMPIQKQEDIETTNAQALFARFPALESTTNARGRSRAYAQRRRRCRRLSNDGRALSARSRPRHATSTRGASGGRSRPPPGCANAAPVSVIPASLSMRGWVRDRRVGGRLLGASRTPHSLSELGGRPWAARIHPQPHGGQRRRRPAPGQYRCRRHPGS